MATAAQPRLRREVAAAMTLCKSHHTQTATPGRRALSRRVIHGERQKLFNPSLDDEAEAEIHVDAPRLRGLPAALPDTVPSRRPSSAGLSPSAEAPSVHLGVRASPSPSARAVRSGALPGQLAHTPDRSSRFVTSPQCSTDSAPQPSPGAALMEEVVQAAEGADSPPQAVEDRDSGTGALVPPIQPPTPRDRAGLAYTSRDMSRPLSARSLSSRPQSARGSATLQSTSSILLQSPRSPKVPRQRVHDGMKLSCDRFLGERIDYDLIQEALHVTATRAEALEIESRSPVLSAFYGRKLDASGKVSVYGNRVISPSARTWNSSLRQIH
eukprot:Tamp_18300.p1 GENE.Tamp_18300~~Tamp_18300.p1  ORF type:complete len:337 (+),score=32.53 Tamp_18300:34-1011(+)